MNTVRDWFPTLNEFTSDVSKSIIAWLYNNNLGRDFKSIFERDDISILIQSCPSIEFIMDGILELYHDTEHLDHVVKYLTNISFTTCVVKETQTKLQLACVHNISKFIGHSRTHARARVLLWDLAQLMYEARGTMYADDVQFCVVRLTIVRCMLNKDNFDYTQQKLPDGSTVKVN